MAQQKSWIEENIPSKECVLCWSSDEGFLNFAGKHIFFHTIDRATLSLAAAAIRRSKSVALMYPVSKVDVAIPVCVEALYALYESSNPRNVLLLVSRDAGSIRHVYSELRTNAFALNTAFPLGIVKADGSSRAILSTGETKRLKDVECKFLHTSNPTILPNDALSEKIGCVIVDAGNLSDSEVSEIAKWASQAEIPSKVFVDSVATQSRVDLYYKEGIPVWGWDGASLMRDFSQDLEEVKTNPQKYSSPFSYSVHHIRNLLEGVKREFVVVEESEVTANLNETLNLYFGMQKVMKQTGSEALHQAAIGLLTCKYAFERMLAPLAKIEDQCKISFLARTVENRIERLKKWKVAIEQTDSASAAMISKGVALAEQLYDQYSRAGCPKYELVLKQTKVCMETGEKIVIMNYNDPYARALIEALKEDLGLSEEELKARGVNVTSTMDGLGDVRFDVCIIFGQVPRNASWLLRTTCAKRVKYLVYPSEQQLLLYQMQTQERRLSSLFSRQGRLDFLKGLINKEKLDHLPEDASEELPLAVGVKEGVIDESVFKPLAEGLFQDEDAVFEEEKELDDDFDDVSIDSSGDVMVKAIKLRLAGGKTLYVRQKSRLPILKDGKLERADPSKAKVGDQIVVIRNSIRDDLAELIIEKADKHPKMQRYNFLVKAWVATLRKGMAENNDTPASFLEKLQKEETAAGVRLITNPLTIYFWREGYIIGPIDPKNVMLIGKIYGDRFLEENYAEVGSAARRIRDIHRKLLRRFNSMVLQAGVSSMKGTSADDIIDEEFNLHIEDFASIVSIEKIEEIAGLEEVAKSKIDRVTRD